MLYEEVLKYCGTSNYSNEEPVSLDIVEHIELFGPYHPAVDLVEDLHEYEGVEKDSVMFGLVERNNACIELVRLCVLNIPDELSEEQED